MAIYQEMKDSGIEWVHEIPNEWSVFPAGAVFKENKQKNVGSKYTQPFSFKYGEIVPKNINGEMDDSLKETLSAYQIVHPNTIMINGLNLNYDFITQRVAIVREKGIITSAYLGVIPDPVQIDSLFAMYLLKAYDYKQAFHGMGSGIRKTLSFKDFKRIKIVAPEIDDQIKIVHYIQENCSKIDSLISEAKSSIEDYKQWKASIIYEAVTKGLDPDAEMKDSGVNWIGEIPENWILSQIKNIAEFMPKCDYSSLNSESEVTFTPMECIRTGSFENRKTTMNGINSSYTAYAEGDIVIAKVTPCFENGNICIMRNLYSGVGFGSSELFVLRPTKILDRFLFYFMQHEGFKQSGCSTMTGTGGLKRVSSTFVKNCPIPYPPISEQEKIADMLDEKCATIQQLISEKESLIADLEAYKKSLIYEVVTGKRRVI